MSIWRFLYEAGWTVADTLKHGGLADHLEALSLVVRAGTSRDDKPCAFVPVGKGRRVSLADLCARREA